MAHVFDRLAAQAMSKIQCHINDNDGSRVTLDMLPEETIENILIRVVSTRREHPNKPHWCYVSLVSKGMRERTMSVGVASHIPSFRGQILIVPYPDSFQIRSVHRILQHPLLSALPWNVQVTLKRAVGRVSPLANTSIYCDDKVSNNKGVLQVLKNANVRVRVVGFGQPGDEIEPLRCVRGRLRFEDLVSLELFHVNNVMPPTTLLLDPNMFPNVAHLKFEHCHRIKSIVGLTDAPLITAHERKLHVKVKSCRELERVQHLSNIGTIEFVECPSLMSVANVCADVLQIRGVWGVSLAPLNVVHINVDALEFGMPCGALTDLPDRLRVTGDVRRLGIYIAGVARAFHDPLNFDVTGLADVRIIVCTHEPGAVKHFASVFRNVTPNAVTRVSLDLSPIYCVDHPLSAEDTATVLRHATEVKLKCLLQEVDLSPLAQPGCRLQKIDVVLGVDRDEEVGSHAIKFLDALRDVPHVTVECLIESDTHDAFPKDALDGWMRYREQQADFRTKFETHP
jgi:hypothetical protein